MQENRPTFIVEDDQGEGWDRPMEIEDFAHGPHHRNGHTHAQQPADLAQRRQAHRRQARASRRKNRKK